MEFSFYEIKNCIAFNAFIPIESRKDFLLKANNLSEDIPFDRKKRKLHPALSDSLNVSQLSLLRGNSGKVKDGC